MRPQALPDLFGRKVRKIHCLGIGGMGVGPLAIYLARSGWLVSGEDDALTCEMEALLDGAGVALGPLSGECDLVVRSSAIPDSHPSLVAAMRKGVPTARRGELLAEALREKKLVAVCGSHGKTTTTAMLVTALRAAGFPAGYVAAGFSTTRRRPRASARTNGSSPRWTRATARSTVSPPRSR